MIVATYSIAACDLDAQQWGVAVQSKFLSVGSVVPWAEPRRRRDRDAGLREPALRPRRARAAARRAAPPRRSCERLVAADDGRDERQLGVVDAHGRLRSWTGAGCHDWAGHRNGPCYAAQGNILVGAETVDALAETFEANARRAARAAADRVPRRGAGGGRRPARPAVGVAARRRARRRLRAALGHPRRPPRRRPRAADRGAPAHLRRCTTGCSGGRRARSGCRSRASCATRSTSGSAGSATTRSRPGPASRTSRSASTATPRSTRSSSRPCATPA